MTAAGPAKRNADLRGLLAAIFVTLVVWQVLTRALTLLFVQAGAPEVALVLRPSNGEALTEIASKVIARAPSQKEAADDVKVANATSTKRLTDLALKTTPLDTRTLRLMAQAAEMMGDKTRSQKLVEIAGAQTIRDTTINLFLLTRDAQRKSYAKAFAHADALLRISNDSKSKVFDILNPIVADPGSYPPMIAVLRAGPPWRADFLESVATHIDDPTTFIDVLLALRGGDKPLKDEDLAAFLNPLISRGMVEQAYYIWLQFLPPKRMASLPYIYNGSFEYRLTNLPFDWTVTSIEGATTTFKQIPEQSGRALFVQFEGKRTPFKNVIQMLFLPPGKHKFSGSYLANDLSNPRGMTWRLYCVQRNDSRPIAETDRVAGTSDGWKDFATTFDVPSDQCGAQWLRLELAARVSIEEAVSGSIWYTNLKISKADGGDEVRRTGPAISQPDRPGTEFERAIRSTR